MSRVMIRYKVKPDQLERNVELLNAFFEELNSVRPDGLRYAAFQLEDKVTFVHFVDAKNGPGSFARLETFQRYRSTIAERCEEPPATTMLHEVGSFGFD
ncbi:hypothetical protein TH66_02670 [Carbonactinospora thermoautotrophica]|uniref:ABM domain-containing protein n=1 Tax=Carbonactinospora thermoautotrophica TaxID=1469144 RepID=A0A132NE99_9ACTN|nr:hypothetical protein [Carbonactinospora thermoautotrophica]KWX01247.1 hypothetical protein LI90_2275 [Carbonactinospora thermoautotrophica]KWX05578.1 hypothetical protein TH66_02670 [Carbonactinospora thermoautotrophica]KWX08441.1 hypothetical protein TR74_14995 [Carbonactinospora thermoautotrophica]